jgi:hypothetical protein
MLALQRAIGNAAVAHLVAGRGVRRPWPPVVQRMTGLAQEVSVADYVAAARSVLEDATAGDQVEDVAARLMAIINQALEQLGVPRVDDWAVVEVGGTEFQTNGWKINLASSSVADAISPGADPLKTQAALVGGIYHEARHAEQAFRGARLWVRDNKGVPRAPDALAAALMTAMQIPLHVARAAIASEGASVPVEGEDREWLTSHGKKEHDELQRQARFADRGFFEVKGAWQGAVGPAIDQAENLAARLGAIEAGEHTLDEYRQSEVFRSEREAVAGALAGYNDFMMTSRAKMREAKSLILRYRRIPEEKDAHLLQWRVENLYYGGDPPPAFAQADITRGENLLSLVQELVDTSREVVEPDDFEMLEGKEARADAALLRNDIAAKLGAVAGWKDTLAAYYDARHHDIYAPTNI